MTKRDLGIAIAHARANGRESLARSLEICWADVLNAPEAPDEVHRQAAPGSPINPVLQREFSWDDVRLEL